MGPLLALPKGMESASKPWLPKPDDATEPAGTELFVHAELCGCMAESWC